MRTTFTPPKPSWICLQPASSGASQSPVPNVPHLKVEKIGRLNCGMRKDVTCFPNILSVFNALIKVKAKTFYPLNSGYFYFKFILVSQRKIKHLSSYSPLSIKSEFFLPFKCCHFLVEACKSCLQEARKYTGGRITLYLLTRRKSTPANRAFAAFLFLIEGPLAWLSGSLSKFDQGLVKDREPYTSRFPPRASQKGIEIKDCYYTKTSTARQQNYPFFLTTWTFASCCFHSFTRMHVLCLKRSWTLPGTEFAVPKAVNLHQAWTLYKKNDVSKIPTAKSEFKHLFVSQNLHALHKLHWDPMNTGIWTNTERWQSYRRKCLKTILLQNIKCKCMKNCLNSFRSQTE